MEIVTYSDRDKIPWQEYVMNSNKSSFYHQIGWKEAIEKCYSLKSCYLLAKEGSSVRGILPLFFTIKSYFFPWALISLPYGNYGGVIGDTPSIEYQLLQKANEIIIKNKIAYLEFKNFHPLEYPILKTKLDYFSLILELDADPSKIWQKKIKGTARNRVRKAQKLGLVAKCNNNYLKEFYYLYTKNMRDLGSPTHGMEWFKILSDIFENELIISIAFFKNQPVGGVFAFLFKDTLIVQYAASEREYLKYCPNNLAYWVLITYACQKGFNFFDFARSKRNQGTYHFKETWGARPHQVYYQYILNNGNKLPQVDSENPKYNLAINVWKKLPLSLTRFFGPTIRKRIPV
ncbi:MAG: FemAB family XrtA/PEP-CTERM system-associated protein [Candidatus Hodarchaeota archaeon]